MNYRGLLLEDTHPSASEDAIAALEGELDARLPDDYRAFLQHCNGAYAEYDVAVMLASGEPEVLSFSSLFGVDIDRQWDCNPFELQQLREQPDYPQQGLLPIGRDGGASLLLLDLRDGGQQIVAMVAGLPAWTGRRQQGNEFVVLANSFDAYLDLLHLTDATVTHHIDSFQVSQDSAEATLAWLDSGSPGWRERFRERWNARVPFMPV
ncbi:SMI1/KNR4 family protein [Phytopseudomonas dryadis]|nr:MULTISPECIES: SMI1/KNR4 family protein [Pseudomonas]